MLQRRPRAGQARPYLSDFSSWGVTPDLKLKPEIAGVGGNIYSTRDPSIAGSNYGLMSGTSMATPQIAGAMAVLMQYLRQNYPQYQEAELRQVAANLLMSTADPILDSNGLEALPERPGRRSCQPCQGNKLPCLSVQRAGL